MDKGIVSLIDSCRDACERHENQRKSQIVALLEIDENSEEALYARNAANECTRKATYGVGGVTYAIGIDFAPCAASCRFCSFGAKWGVANDNNSFVLSHNEVVSMAREHLQQGANGIILRTTEYYPHDDLMELVKRVRCAIPGKHSITVNTGELTLGQCVEFFEAGAQGACHMLRLREGVDTPFDPDVRLATIKAICDSPLNWATCIDPIGPEHTPEEIADLLLTIQSFEPLGCGTQKRINVKGTPFGDGEELSKERCLLIAAAVRLSSGRMRATGCHPGYEEVLYSGGCAFNIETGAVPRAHDYVDNEWGDITVPEAVAMLHKAGYKPSLSFNSRVIS
jgi:biotin synthase